VRAQRALRGSSNLPTLLFLLAILAAGGAWNYQRNLKAEEAQPRPYRSYSDENLEALRAAYQDEVDKHTARYRNASERKVKVHDRGYVAANVAEFERVQRISQGKRAIADQYAKNQVQLDLVQAEIDLRASLADGWKLHLQRLTKYP
jgi:hypothetical protein